ncbi:hypothetical protein DAKH74_047000 [Maudiozyma humilis]|uniref:Receptor L-domain domain-containing protein n=1 Tax=Maudiozyma humilis TaxID=51915 RepID=A0AAV5S5T7_MAUHU|nr:hypothetical protein DAKH74_047000 [Kazachstania humilis]
MLSFLVAICVLLQFSQASQALHNDFISSVRASETRRSGLAPRLAVCGNSSHLIQQQGDIDMLIRVCSDNIQGDIVVSSLYSDPSLDLGSIKSISGDMVIADCVSLSVVHLPELQSIEGSFKVSNITELSAIVSPKLKAARSLVWQKLPLLTDALLGDRLDSLEDVLITGTDLVDVDFLHKLKEVRSMDLNNNPSMQRVDLALQKVSERLSIYSNYDGTDVQLNLLKVCEELFVKSADSLGLNSLRYVGKSASFVDNSLSKLKLKSLKHVNGTLSLVDNTNLDSVDLPNLTNVDGGILVVNGTTVYNSNALGALDQIFPYTVLTAQKKGKKRTTTSSTTILHYSVPTILRDYEQAAAGADLKQSSHDQSIEATDATDNSSVRVGASTLRMIALWLTTLVIGLLLI